MDGSARNEFIVSIAAAGSLNETAALVLSATIRAKTVALLNGAAVRRIMGSNLTTCEQWLHGKIMSDRNVPPRRPMRGPKANPEKRSKGAKRSVTIDG